MKNIFRSNIDFYFIFQKINFEIFLNDYAKLFTYKLYKKGEKLLIQNSYSEGVFLVRVGRIRVYTERDLDEIGGLIMSLEYCLEGYSEHISSLHKGNIINNEEKNRLKNPIYKTKEYLENSKGKKIIEMDVFNEKEILGLNEFYDYKSQFNLFTAECLTDCIIFYIPKKMMNIIVGKENSVKYHVLNLIELKAKYYIGKLKNYRDNFLKEIGFKLGYTQNQIENINKLKVKEKNNSNDLISLRKNFNKVYSKMSNIL
jgi:CRP-like cAMP-binding protein